MFQQQHPEDFTHINYHMSWPGTDPYYSYNSTEADVRRGYYGITGIPYFAVDGINTGSWQNQILQNASTSAPLSINLSGTYDYLTGDGNLMVTLAPEAGVSGNYTLYAVLVEDGLYYAGTNGYPDHEAVMRDMLPTGSGTTVNLQAGVSHVETFAFHVASAFVLENCRIVVFVQAGNGTVLNAASSSVTSITPVNIPQLSIIEEAFEVIDDDGDGKVNPGETANLILSIENACDWVDAQGVLGTLTTSNPYVTILDATADYDLIVACDFIENTSDYFQITVADDAPSVLDLDFTLVLTANMDTEVPYHVNLNFIYSMNLFQLNFPVEFTQPAADGNAVVDLDGDGSMEVVIGGNDSLLHVLTLSGTELTGFPFAAANKLQGSPAVADIDNDGDLEIVFVARDGGIYVVQHDGSGEMIASATSYLLGTPALSDFDGDGDLEIVAGGWGYDLLVVHHDGSALPGFPKILTGERMSTAAAVADIDGDGVDDILIGTWSDKLHVFDYMGNELAGFPVNVGDDIKAPPVVTDLDGDNEIEILVGQDEGLLTVLSASGQVLWTHAEASDGIRTAPAIADLDGDGTREIILTAEDGFVTVIDHTGADLAGWPIYLGSSSYSSPVVADIDGDGNLEVFMGSDGELIHGFYLNGSTLFDFPVEVSGQAKGTPTIADLDQDGNLEILAGTNSGLTVIDIKDLGSNTDLWCTDRGDYRRTGAYLYGFVVSTDPQVNLPQTLSLAQNYPNPFNPTTKLEFGVPTSERVNLTIFDIRGQEVVRLIDRDMTAGNYSVTWNGLDASASAMETGVYFARIQAGSSEQVIKMMLLK